MKARKILSLIINLVAVIASIVGFIIIRDSLKLVMFIKYFTLVTNMLIIVVGLISIGYSVDALIKKDKEVVLPTAVFALKLITGVGAMITFLTVVFYLQHTSLAPFGPKDPVFWNNIMHHYAAPLAFTAGLIFFDLDKKYPFKTTFFGIIVLVTYMIYAIPLSNLNQSWWGEAPYVFMSWQNVQWLILLLLPGFLVAGYGLSVLLWVLNRICYLIFIGEEVDEDDIDEEEVKVEKLVEVTQEDENKVNEIIKTGYNGPRIYHVSKRDDKMWQVKFANGKKAIQLFPTQAEAIVFAKKLAKSQAGSIRVHSLKGRIRKAH